MVLVFSWKLINKHLIYITGNAQNTKNGKLKTGRQGIGKRTNGKKKRKHGKTEKQENMETGKQEINTMKNIKHKWEIL